MLSLLAALKPIADGEDNYWAMGTPSLWQLVPVLYYLSKIVPLLLINQFSLLKFGSIKKIFHTMCISFQTDSSSPRVISYLNLISTINFTKKISQGFPFITLLFLFLPHLWPEENIKKHYIAKTMQSVKQEMSFIL